MRELTNGVTKCMVQIFISVLYTISYWLWDPSICNVQ